MKGRILSSKDGRGRDYAFLVSVSNPSDSSNAIAQADLAITYRTLERTQVEVKIRAGVCPALKFSESQDTTLMIPVSISAHSAVSGWLRFRVPASLLTDVAIESYRLILTDPHQEETILATTLIQEHWDEA